MPQAEIARRSSLAKSNGRSSGLATPVGEVEIVRQRVRDHLRLLVDFLFHEMPVIALVDHEGGAERLLALALDRRAVHVEDLRLDCGARRPSRHLQIGDRVGEGRQRDGVGAEEHLALAVADRQRRAVAGADDQVLVALEHDGQRKGALQPLQRIDARPRRARRPCASSRATRCATTSVSVCEVKS